MRRFYKFAFIAAVLSTSVATTTSTVAAAATPGCGDTIIQDTVLQSDIGPCSNGGLVIGAHNITLDLNGHRIFGTGATGDGSGILVNRFHGVTIKNGAVTYFDIGIDLILNQSALVRRMQVAHNISGPGGVGVGISMSGSQFSRVTQNQIIKNGPSSGIFMFSTQTVGNTIDGNQIEGNSATLPSEPDVYSTTGMTLHSGISNRVLNNVIRGNGYAGIALGPAIHNSIIRGNIVDGNGFHPGTSPAGEGIQAGPDNGLFDRRNPTANNLIEANQVRGNAAGGIVVTAGSTQVLRNVAVGNVRALKASNFPTFDLHDRRDSCSTNTWSGNTFGTAFPSCTTGP